MKTMKKQIIILLTLFLLVAVSCNKDDNEPKQNECIKESLTKTIVGKWKVEDENATVEFKSDKTYTDVSKVLHVCDTGKWDVYNNDKDFELECNGNHILVFSVKSFTCDTVIIDFYPKGYKLIREK